MSVFGKQPRGGGNTPARGARQRLIVGVVLLACIPVLIVADRHARETRNDRGTAASLARDLVFRAVLYSGVITVGLAIGQLVAFWHGARWKSTWDHFRRFSRLCWALTLVLISPAFVILLKFKELYAPLGSGGVLEPMTRGQLYGLYGAWLLGLLLWLIVMTAASRGVAWRAYRACRHCGYNLTGHFGDRCPECGESTIGSGDDTK